MNTVTQTHIQVRYAETDQMGIAHHSCYAVWFEQARTEMIREAGIRYRNLEKMGLLLPLTGLDCRYKIPALYEDDLIIETSVVKLTAARISFGYRVLRDGTEIATGQTDHAFVGADFKPLNIKKHFPQVFETLCGFLAEDSQ